MFDSIWVRDRRMCLISRLLCIRAFSWMKLFDPVKFNFVSLYSSVVKLNESVDASLLSVFLIKGMSLLKSSSGVILALVLLRRVFGQVPFSEWVRSLEIDSSDFRTFSLRLSAVSWRGRSLGWCSLFLRELLWRRFLGDLSDCSFLRSFGLSVGPWICALWISSSDSKSESSGSVVLPSSIRSPSL